MKTKIIYISGAEIFDTADVRAALDEVRTALSLPSDTILFGVPVDCDDALTTIEKPTICTDSTPDTPKNIVENIPSPQPEIQLIIDTKPTPKTDDAPVIPILSVLGTNHESTESDTPVADMVSPVETNDATITESVVTNVESTEQIYDDTDDNIDLGVTPAADAEIIHMDTESDTMSDMLNADAPVTNTEKTLEQLLKSIAPLREDIGFTAPTDDTLDQAPVDTDNTPIAADSMGESDTDATLNQLANEFVQTQDKIVTTPKATTHGKIGKLKNILPFKKARREDTGIMGDLFGWAGIAANDEDFSIPGFFTSAGGKK